MNYKLVLMPLFFYPLANSMDYKVGDAYDLIAPAMEKLEQHIKITKSESPFETLEKIAKNKPIGIDSSNDTKVLEECGFPKNMNGYTPVIKEVIITAIKEYRFDVEEKAQKEKTQLDSVYAALLPKKK